MTRRAPDRLEERRRAILDGYAAAFAEHGVSLRPDEPADGRTADELALYIPEARVVVYDQEMGLGQLRSTLEHELVHVELGHGGEPEWEASAREGTVEELTARRLLGLPEIAEALALGLRSEQRPWLIDARLRLEVDMALLQLRLRTLTGDESKAFATLFEQAMVAAAGGDHADRKLTAV